MLGRVILRLLDHSGFLQHSILPLARTFPPTGLSVLYNPIGKESDSCECAIMTGSSFRKDQPFARGTQSVHYHRY